MASDDLQPAASSGQSVWQCLSNGLLSLPTEQSPSSCLCLMQVSHRELSGLEHTSLLQAPPQPKVGQLAG